MAAPFALSLGDLLPHMSHKSEAAAESDWASRAGQIFFFAVWML